VREVIAVCRSTKRSRERVAAVLDRYFWRIGDRTWRGRASNACLDRVARELRHVAKRNTAVVIHEIRSARESRVPIVRIGSRRAFSAGGLVPVSTAAAGRLRPPPRPEREQHALALLRVAALWHDLGKATRLFQDKLRRALKPGAKPEADAVRHELFSAVAWDCLVSGRTSDEDVVALLRGLTPETIDQACRDAAERLRRLHAIASTAEAVPLSLGFAVREGTIAYAVGMLVLTHHRLPSADPNHLDLTAERHVNAGATLEPQQLEIAPGSRFWHEGPWLSALRRAADGLRPGSGAPCLDLALRAALMFADHLGSALKQARDPAAIGRNEHLGNTLDGRPADDLDTHVARVLERVPGCYDMLHRHRERYPALDVEQVPLGLMHPRPAPETFAWQARTAEAARALCGGGEGGFFACLLAGTGTGKTRGAPTILTAAAFADARPERRYLRMTLGLGLVSLASQGAQDYVDDLGFDAGDVAVLVGQPPVRFSEEAQAGNEADGSESAHALPSWIEVERATGGAPPEGDEREPDWLRRLSFDTDRGLPATLALALEHAGNRAAAARRLVLSPLVVGTIDHLMAAASPAGSRFLFPALRVLTADLILDEIDQYDPEDLAAIGRLVFQAGAGGRRVVVMSATLTDDLARALHAAYRAGWAAHAAATGAADHVHVLCAGDAPGSCATNGTGEAFEPVFARCRDAVLARLASAQPRRRTEILLPVEGWDELVDQVDRACATLHDANATEIEGFRVSVGFVRITRIRHAAALAVQLPAGSVGGRLRLKLCLHSRFPRLHRAYMERMLKKALTRKGPDPHAGLRDLCRQEKVFERARAFGCREVEIVVVCSPVIETGNDLDFDWAIIDPVSLRAVVQAAGRVWRHRRRDRDGPNVMLLGRSLVAMSDGALSRPGVETRPDNDTGVPVVSLLTGYKGRKLRELIGEEALDRVDASLVLRTSGAVPLRAAEAHLQWAMINTSTEDAPLARYIQKPTARLNGRAARSRMFRRATQKDLLYTLQGDDPDDAVWMVDFASGTRESKRREAEKSGLIVSTDLPEHRLLLDLRRAASAAVETWGSAMMHSTIAFLMSAVVPDYGREANPRVTYGEWTGFTHGSPKDLCAHFGKST
jgi:CRISPR-associated endonuclease/helicase Cas3